MDAIRPGFVVKAEKWARYKYNLTTPLGKDGKRLTGCKEHIALSKKTAGEGMILLENDGILPLKKGSRIALLGVGSLDYIKGGGGSGNVYCAYAKNIYDGFCEKGDDYKTFDKLTAFYDKHCKAILKKDPKCLFIIEPETPESLVKEAAENSDIAIITIHRFSSESYDRSSEKGDFYLTDNEEKLVNDATKYFKQIVVVLNIGGIIDVSWIKTNKKIKACLLSWQAGMEAGSAVADILCGDINPSGKTTDTFAKSFNDYPFADTFAEDPDYVNYYEDIYVGYRYFLTIPGAIKNVEYPFGYGLSYTTFEFSKPEAKENGKKIYIQVFVTNTGKTAGKEVVQVYYSAPQGKLGKPAIELCAFKKTKLLKPGETQKIALSFKIEDMASFDDLGKIQSSAYVLEKGEYTIFVGNSSVNLTPADYKYVVKKDTVTKQLKQLCPPNKLERRMLSDGTFEELPSIHRNPPQNNAKLKKIIPEYRDVPYQLIDVANGVVSLDEFMAQMSDNELIDLLGGHPSLGVANTSGFGGNERLGIPLIMTCDGPAGVRILPKVGIATTSWPCATLIASTFNTELMYKIGKAGALEVKENGLAVWLTPALNIHRNPLCGRNFEYFSEDPLISGKFAAAMVNGIQSQKIGASAKHFACNNREENRKHSDSRVSERALREIYLKGFEICVKESQPYTIMTSYNIINDILACENFDLITGILRGEWKFKGMVTSDWDPTCYHPNCVIAGNDVRMPRGYADQLREVHRRVRINGFDRAKLAASAKRVLELILKFE